MIENRYRFVTTLLRCISMRPFASRPAPASSTDLPGFPVSRVASISASQWAWAILGFVILLFIAVISATNLEEIYNAQKDFVAGSLFSLVGFSFGKALSGTNEQQALSVLREASTPKLQEILVDDTRRRLHYNDVFASLARVERLIESSSERVHQFLDEPQSQSRSVDFYRDRLGDVLAMFDETGLHTSQLRDRLERTVAIPVREEVWTTLSSITSRVGRANLRRLEMKTQLWASEPPMDADTLAMITVLGTDMLSARRILTALAADQSLESLSNHLSVVADFLGASTQRAQALRLAVEGTQGRVPLLFDVMADDLTKALDGVEQLKTQAVAHWPVSAAEQPLP